MAVKFFQILFKPQLNFTIASTLNTNINTNQTRTNDLIRPKLQFELIATYIIQVGLGTFNAAFLRIHSNHTTCASTLAAASYGISVRIVKSLETNAFVARYLLTLTASPNLISLSLAVAILFANQAMRRGFLLPGHYVHEQLRHLYHFAGTIFSRY
ncbi:hypothetical protein ACFX1X_031619 [Malus domestica]